MGDRDLAGRVLVAVHVGDATVDEPDHMDDHHRAVFRGRRMRHVVPVGWVGDGGRRHREAPQHDRLGHPRFLVLVKREVRGVGLHLDEAATRRVLHDRNAIPLRCVAEQLVLDVGDEHDLGADCGQWPERGVEVVRFAPGDRARSAVSVLRDVAVLHEVDHPHRAVAFGRGRGEVARGTSGRSAHTRLRERPSSDATDPTELSEATRPRHPASRRRSRGESPRVHSTPRGGAVW